jgi:uncharacterized OB-fold protein
VAGSRHLIPDLCEMGPDGPRLLGSRCNQCGAYTFPRRTVCARCKLRSMELAYLGERGTLYSFTVCHVAPAGWEAPYLQAYVEIPEGIRVFSLIASSVPAEVGSLSRGTPMELVLEALRPGSEITTFKYRPVEAHA